MPLQIQIKRAYEPPDKGDGQRILVDRLWPRGVKKENAALDLWVKEAAPSTELRKWFGHDAGKWKEFQRRYRAELKKNEVALQPLVEDVRKGRVTLIYGARDETHNNAVALKTWLEER